MADYDYATAQNALARKRKLAEMLQQQAFAPAEMPTVAGAKLSPWTIAIKAMMGGMAGYQADKADAEAKADAATRESEASKLMGEIPTDTPGVPSQPIEQEKVGPPAAAQVPPPAPPPGLEQAFGPGGMPGAGVPPKDNEFTGSGSQIAAKLLGGEPPPANPLAPPPGPGAAPEGPPMLPQNPLGAEGGAQPFAPPEKKDMSFPGMIPKKFTDAIEGKESTPQEWAKWGSKFNKLGPEYADIAKTAATGAIKAAMPMTKQEKVAAAETRASHIAAEQQRIEDLRYRGEKDKADRAQRELDEKRRSDDKRYTTDENNETRRVLAQAIAAGKGDKSEGGTVSGGHTNIAGDILSYNSHTGKFTNTRTGKEHIQTDADPIIQKEDRKEILDTTKLLTTAAYDRDIATAVLEDAKQNPGKGAFSGGNNTRAALSAATSGIVDPAQKLKMEQQILRSAVTRNVAEEMHTLYGASFTDSERKQASDIMKMPFSSPEQIAAKLNAQAQFREMMASAHSPKSYTVAQARVAQTRSKKADGGAPAAAPSSQGWTVNEKPKG